MFRKVIKKIANRLGFDVIRIQNNHCFLEKHLSNVFAKFSIDCVIDVGANTGQYAALLRRMGFKGWVVSFEPVESVFERLVEGARGDEKRLCYQLALGEKAERKMINVYGCSDFSSFLRATDYAKRIWEPLKNVVPEEVNVVRLDDIFSEVVSRTGCRSYFLKLDTQGYDVNVFRGGMQSLERICAIQTELSLINVYNNTLPPYDVLKEFNRHNYLVSGMYPINRDESLAVIEYDCVLVKNTSLDGS